MKPLQINFTNCPESLYRALLEIVSDFPERFSDCADGMPLAFELDATLKGASVRCDGNGVLVRYGRTVDALRALGRLMGNETASPEGFTETPQFSLRGAMFDVSRNAVMTPDTVKQMIRRCALMGLNTLMLYTEDTYEVPGEPFFGYLRGRYTQAELRDLDDYADAFGVEMIPCIQALAHMEQMLQWPAYADYRDTDTVLLAEDEKTYALIERLLDAATAPVRSRRIHLGMDEAHGIGQGRYRQLYGEKRPFEILNAHLKRVVALCEQRGLKPMIWSDMYFRLGSATNNYYDPESVIPEDAVAAVPAGVELVYWDYYHRDADFYREWIDRHRQMGKEPIMAGGVWTWNRLWAALPFSFVTTEACMTACREKGLQEVFVTLWGDDGGECDVFSALPGLQYFAELVYAGKVDPQLLRANFRGSCNADFDDWVKAAELDAVPGWIDHVTEQTWHSAGNASKWLLWQDPLLGLMEPHTAHDQLTRHYTELAATLSAAAEKGGLAPRLRFPALIAGVLALKCPLRRALAAAYAAKDDAQLEHIADELLPALRTAVDELWACHRDLWLAACKPFGLEVIERRYGGLRTRLESLAVRLRRFRAGETDSIPELETALQKIFAVPDDVLPLASYARVATPSFIK